MTSPAETFQALAFHVLGSFAVAVLLYQVHRNSPKSYLLQWTRSFASLVAFHLATSLLILRADSGETARLLQVLLSVIAGAAAYLQIGWLAWGCFELAKAKPLKIHESQRLLLILVVAGVVSGTIPFLLAKDPAIHRFFYLGLHAFASAAAFGLCGAAIRRFRGSGFTVPAAAFIGYGGVQLGEFIFIMRGLLAQDGAMPFLPIATADLIGSVIVALAAVLAVLEDQREEAAAATSQVEHLAYYDTLTGLPNRTLFSDRVRVALAHAQRHHYKVAVLFLDVDRFRHINDSLGHTVGDRLLKTIATRIKASLRDEDTLARFGGDEFTVLIHIIGKIEDAGKIAQKILDSIKLPMMVDEREFVVTTSIGISIYPIDGTDGETLIRNADTAMNRAKDVGGNSYHFYAAAMNHKALEALEVENGLRRALAQNEFVLYYQPLVDVATQSVYGLEALCRWQHPQYGLLRPDRFIPAAEESGLIIPLGRWVMREACRQGNEWHRRGHKVVVAVNLSAKQFQDPDLLRQIREALDGADFRPEYLEVEITEGNAMQDVEKAILILKQLKSIGVRIAIDDFGTGYSCLSYLKQFPIDSVKLDGSFVRDLSSPQDAQIALGIIALAHSLKLKVIAEGVETIGQLTFLREHDCDRLQGYLFSRPMPAANFDRFIRSKDALQFAYVPMRSMDQ